MDSLDASMGSLAVRRRVQFAQGAIPKNSMRSVTIYRELLEIEESDGTIANQTKIDCAICLTAIDIGNGVVLRNCLHSFCKDCVNRLIVTTDTCDIKCPHIANENACQEILQDKEIRALLSAAEYNEYLVKTLRFAENSAANSFHCLTPNCPMWFIADGNIRKFRCPICRGLNCVPCKVGFNVMPINYFLYRLSEIFKAFHPRLSCVQFRAARRATDDQSKTKQVLEEMVNKGDGMYCPKCQVHYPRYNYFFINFAILYRLIID